MNTTFSPPLALPYLVVRQAPTGVAALAVATLVAGCTSTGGTPVADSSSSVADRPAGTSAPTSASVASSSVVPSPTGTPVGTAVMKVMGDGSPVTIRYRINGGPEQTETGAALPWEKEFPVYEKLDSEVSVDGGEAVLTCTIIFKGDKLVSFKTEARPTCEFAYWD